MPVTHTGIVTLLRATGHVTLDEHCLDLGRPAVGDPNVWIDEHGDWVIKLDPAAGTFEMFMDGEEDAIEDGDFEELAALIEAGGRNGD